MTSRRPMTRSFSANGRTSSFNDEDGNSSNGRRERSNSYLSNVRPENRYAALNMCNVNIFIKKKIDIDRFKEMPSEFYPFNVQLENVWNGITEAGMFGKLFYKIALRKTLQKKNSFMLITST